jgi:hypothetical protein
MRPGNSLNPQQDPSRQRSAYWPLEAVGFFKPNDSYSLQSIDAAMAGSPVCRDFPMRQVASPDESTRPTSGDKNLVSTHFPNRGQWLGLGLSYFAQQVSHSRPEILELPVFHPYSSAPIWVHLRLKFPSLIALADSAGLKSHHQSIS